MKQPLAYVHPEAQIADNVVIEPFVSAISGNIMRMPGLPKVPAANNMDIDEEGKITGLF